MGADLRQLEAALGHEFRDRELLVRALTHISRGYESAPPGAAPVSNEQLEFLGDAILGLIVSEHLFRILPADREGRLSKLKACFVSESRLYGVAQSLSLGEYLALGRGEEMSGGRLKKAILADAVEAVIAALYLDAGLEAARAFVDDAILGDCSLAEAAAAAQATDYKTALQERAQALRLPQPRYSVVAESGPEHAKVFTVEVRAGQEWAEKGAGTTKKAAGQRAAGVLLSRLDRASAPPGNQAR